MHAASDQSYEPQRYHAQASPSDEEGQVDMELEAVNTGADGQAEPTAQQQQEQRHGEQQQRESMSGEQQQRQRRGQGEETQSSEEGGESGAEYEFTAWEERVMEVVMEAMRMAGLALAMRAMATICLGARSLPCPCQSHAVQPLVPSLLCQNLPNTPHWDAGACAPHRQQRMSCRGRCFLLLRDEGQGASSPGVTACMLCH